MPSEHKPGNVPYDIIYTAKRKPNWDNDSMIGKLGEGTVKRILRIFRQRNV